MSNRYRLELVKLHRTHLQDTLSRDEPKILVNGVTIYGPGDIGKGQTVDLGNRPEFHRTYADYELTFRVLAA